MKVRGSAAFRRWFAGSKAVTESGEPRVLFHGTRSPLDFDEFQYGDVIGDDGCLVVQGAGDPTTYMGPHFAQEYEVASRFALGRAAAWDSERYVSDGDHGGRVIPVYLSAKRPKAFAGDEQMFSWVVRHGRSSELEDSAWQMAQQGYFRDEIEDPDDFDYRSFLKHEPTVRRVFNWMNQAETENGSSGAAPAYCELGRSAAEALVADGYDSVTYNNNVEGGISWIALKPGMVKSVWNSGSWDPSSNSLTDPSSPSTRGTRRTRRTRRA